MKNLLLSLAVFFLVWSQSMANTPVPQLASIKRLPLAQVQSKAEMLYVQKDYKHAYYYYLALSQMKKRFKLEERYRLGVTALYAGDAPLASHYLELCLKHRNRFPLVEFEYARSLKNRGDYKKAMVYFQRYLRHARKDGLANDYLAAARYHMKGCETALQTQEYANYSISQVSSVFEQGGSMRALTLPNKYGYKLVEYQDERGICLKKVSPEGEVLALKSLLGNPSFNAGAPFIGPDGETVLFSRQETTHNGNLEAKIYRGKMLPDGEVVEIQKLDASINRDGFSSLYPTMGINEKGQEVLYFSSNMPGGEGGYDIWYAVRMSNGEFTRPYNLGRRINSADDEITPFYHDQAQEIYFSSNKPEGFGGFDVYKMQGAKQQWQGSKAEHLAYPINSYGNDYHFLIDENGQGQLTTDRAGKKDKPLRVTDLDKARAANNKP